MLALVYFNVVWFLSGLVTGITSFGSNLFAVPLIALVWEPRQAILVGCLSAFSIFFELAVVYRSKILWKDTLLLSLGSLAGIPLGIWFLGQAGSRALLLAAGASLAIFLLWQCLLRIFGAQQKKIGFAWVLPLGFLSGILMGSIGMGGPPLVLYTFLRQFSKEETLATINAASVAIMLFVLPGQYLSGLFDPETIKLGAIGGVAAFIGILASIPLARHINIGLFRKLLLAMLALSMATLFLRALI